MANPIQRGQTSTILLECLLNCDKYGSELLTTIQQKYDEIDIKQPTLYSTLGRMEKQGLISSYWRDSYVGGKRHYYSITDFGKKTLQSLQNDLQEKTMYQEKKYDEIDHFEKKDEQLIEEKKSKLNYNDTNSPFFIKNELIKKHKQNPSSFADNLIQQKANQLDDARLIERNEIYNIPSEKSVYVEQNKINEKKNDDGVFITEKIVNIPKVKKLDSLNLKLNNQDDVIAQKISSENIIREDSELEKIENLYNCAKNTDNNESSQFEFQNQQKVQSCQNLQELKKRYDDMNIKFYANNTDNEKIVSEYGQLPKNKLFAKYFTIFVLILFESLGVWLTFFLLKPPVEYQFAYIILPIIFAIISFGILFGKKKTFHFERKSGIALWISILIFVVGIAVIYLINSLVFGVSFDTLIDHPTTLIYPAILMTNVVVAGIFDYNFAKKYL